MSVNYAEAVAKGASLLDEAQPNWVDRIQTGDLQMSDERNCILGQIFDLFDVGARSLTLDNQDCVEAGFVCEGVEDFDVDPALMNDGCDECNALQAEWIELIKTRRSL